MLHIRLYAHVYLSLACVVMSEPPYVSTIRNAWKKKPRPLSALYACMEPAQMSCEIMIVYLYPLLLVCYPLLCVCVCVPPSTCRV